MTIPYPPLRLKLTPAQSTLRLKISQPSSLQVRFLPAIPGSNAAQIAAGKIDAIGSSTDLALVRWRGTDGRTVQDSNVLLGPLGNMLFPSGGSTTFTDGTPASPAAGQLRLFGRSVGGIMHAWTRDSAGTETDLNLGGGGGISGSGTDKHIVRWDGTSAVQDSYGATIDDFGSVAIAPAGGFHTGLKVGQVLSGTLGAGQDYANLVAISGDTANAEGSGTNGLTGFSVYHATGGATAKGNRYAAQLTLGFNGATDPTATANDMVAAWLRCEIGSPNGGTNLGAGARGSFWGANITANAVAGATNLNSVMGLEINAALLTGSSAAVKNGLRIAQLGGDTVQGAVEDAGIAFHAGAGSAGWKNGILFSNFHGAGPVATSGTLITADKRGGIWTADKGIDLSEVFFITAAYKSTGFLVDGVGRLETRIGDFTSYLPVTSNNMAPINQFFAGTDSSATGSSALVVAYTADSTLNTKCGLWVETIFLAPTALATIGSNIAQQNLAHMIAGSGGNLNANQTSLYGFSTFVKLGQNVTNLFNLSGGEIDFEAQLGSSVTYKNGWAVVLGPDDRVQGSLYDTGYALSSATPNNYLKTGFLIGDMHGGPPLGATSTIIATTGAATVTNGVDFSSYTFTGSAFKSPGFAVDGAGAVLMAANNPGNPPASNLKLIVKDSGGGNYHFYQRNSAGADIDLAVGGTATVDLTANYPWTGTHTWTQDIRTAGAVIAGPVPSFIEAGTLVTQVTATAGGVYFGDASTAWIYYNGGFFDWSGGRVEISDATASISPTTGALQVVGGVGIGGNLNVAGFAGIGGPAVSPATLLVEGGSNGSGLTEVLRLVNKGASAGDGPSINFCWQSGGGQLGARIGLNPIASNAGYLLFQTGNGAAPVTRMTIEAAGAVRISATTASTSSTSGALIVAGGVGIGEALNIAGNFTATKTGTLSFTLNSTGQVFQNYTSAGGINWLFKDNSAGGDLKYLNIISGGGVTQFRTLTDVGDAKDALMVFDHSNGQLQYLKNTDSTSSANGAVIYLGGVGIGKALNVAGAVSGRQSLATPAAASAVAGLTMGSAAVGFYWGTGAPSVTAPKGSIYIRTDATTTTTRLYINTNAGTTWANFTTSA
jgi:hypothetical protein